MNTQSIIALAVVVLGLLLALVVLGGVVQMVHVKNARKAGTQRLVAERGRRGRMPVRHHPSTTSETAHWLAIVGKEPKPLPAVLEGYDKEYYEMWGHLPDEYDPTPDGYTDPLYE